MTSPQYEHIQKCPLYLLYFVPGRGWTYNLSGFNCVKLSVGRKTVRIGTDDVQGLLAFLDGKVTGRIPAA